MTKEALTKCINRTFLWRHYIQVDPPIEDTLLPIPLVWRVKLCWVGTIQIILKAQKHFNIAVNIRFPKPCSPMPASQNRILLEIKLSPSRDNPSNEKGLIIYFCFVLLYACNVNF